MGDAVLLMPPDQMLEALPHRQMAVALWPPVAVQFVACENANFASRALDDSGMLHTFHRNASCRGDTIGCSIFTSLQTVLFEPGDGEAGIRIQLALAADRKSTR